MPHAFCSLNFSKSKPLVTEASVPGAGLAPVGSRHLVRKNESTSHLVCSSFTEITSTQSKQAWAFRVKAETQPGQGCSADSPTPGPLGFIHLEPWPWAVSVATRGLTIPGRAHRVLTLKHWIGKVQLDCNSFCSPKKSPYYVSMKEKKELLDSL